MKADQEKLTRMLLQEETILSLVRCSLEIFHNRFIPRTGLLALTNNRILFIEDDRTTEEYFYENITYFIKEDSVLGCKLFVRYGDVLARIEYIQGDHPEAFAALLQQKICPSIASSS